MPATVISVTHIRNGVTKLVFDVQVVYKAPSKEELFLGFGWGSRDVRGPYLSAEAAEIIIPNWALSSEIASTVKLSLSVSNRCKVDALIVRATGVFGSAQKLVKEKRRCSSHTL